MDIRPIDFYDLILYLSLLGVWNCVQTRSFAFDKSHNRLMIKLRWIISKPGVSNPPAGCSPVNEDEVINPAESDVFSNRLPLFVQIGKLSVLRPAS